MTCKNCCLQIAVAPESYWKQANRVLLTYSSPWSKSGLEWKCESHSVVSNSFRPHGLYSPWNYPGQNTGVGSLSFLQGIFPTQGLNPGLLHCRQILYQLSHKGSPRVLGWVAYSFSSRSSWPRDQTRVFCIAGGFFTNWAISERGIMSSFIQIVLLLAVKSTD